MLAVVWLFSLGKPEQDKGRNPAFLLKKGPGYIILFLIERCFLHKKLCFVCPAGCILWLRFALLLGKALRPAFLHNDF